MTAGRGKLGRGGHGGKVGGQGCRICDTEVSVGDKALRSCEDGSNVGFKELGNEVGLETGSSAFCRSTRLCAAASLFRQFLSAFGSFSISRKRKENQKVFLFYLSLFAVQLQ